MWCVLWWMVVYFGVFWCIYVYLWYMYLTLVDAFTCIYIYLYSCALCMLTLDWWVYW